MTRARDLGDFIADGAAPELVVDTTTLVVDSTNNRVGIGTASPSQALEVTGTAKLATVDIDAGAIDGAVIGGNSAAAGTFTTATVAVFVLNGTSVSGIGTSANQLVKLDSNGKLGAIDGSALTGIQGFSYASTLAFGDY
tara:strand:+ start:1056 stop:1472 length:417 start_codon:yes stop_codon:yes gene_type:complete